ncbi:hypothetical protein EVAR_23467_1 [Eumeta japonica]|uniref:Uncharacterized protein n=1 Tax=Eumeta variegata TaxID=151549 RepID=A0A4C1UL58_EUMVA|nr:hypothetical protein EVAR_23467_1 [Eumeta japonica]
MAKVVGDDLRCTDHERFSWSDDEAGKNVIPLVCHTLLRLHPKTELVEKYNFDAVPTPGTRKPSSHGHNILPFIYELCSCNAADVDSNFALRSSLETEAVSIFKLWKVRSNAENARTVVGYSLPKQFSLQFSIPIAVLLAISAPNRRCP